jgi:hypothetical protein
MKLMNFVVCDDIRFEIGGKHTLVGVYDDLVFNVLPNAENNWPLIIRLAFFVRLQQDEGEKLDADRFEFCVTQIGLSEKVPVFSQPIIKPIDTKTIHLIMTIGAFAVFKEGQIAFHVNFFKGQEIVLSLPLGTTQVHTRGIPSPTQ